MKVLGDSGLVLRKERLRDLVFLLFSGGSLISIGLLRFSELGKRNPFGLAHTVELFGVPGGQLLDDVN